MMTHLHSGSFIGNEIYRQMDRIRKKIIVTKVTQIQKDKYVICLYL